MRLSSTFYIRDDVTQISKELIGKVLCTNIDNILTEAIITETEAYCGVTDKASHAYGGRRTNRTEIMYQKGGIAYVYLCYGMYSLFNVVTNKIDIPHAILIRGAIPVTGILTMQNRTGKKPTDNLLIGPGKLSKAMGIHYSHTGTSLSGDLIWIEDRKIIVPEDKIKTTPRIGVDYAGECAKLPYRFVILKNDIVMGAPKNR
jgi:DNA-3-methyladenine glycosylase